MGADSSNNDGQASSAETSFAPSGNLANSGDRAPESTSSTPDVPQETHSSDSRSTPASEIDEKENLGNLRDTWKSMLKVSPQDGDAFYLVPTSFLEKSLELELAASIAHLKAVLGKLDCSSIVDNQGALLEQSEESDAFTQISPELFHQLVSVFGLHGDPVIRNIVVMEDGSAHLERNPPFFIVHGLSDAHVSPRQQSLYDRSNQQYRCSFSLSQSKTFHHLIDAIKTCMFKAKNIDIRVWFVASENVEELPPSIPVSMFINDIDEKKLILPDIMENTLRSQGITSSRFHLVAESANKTTRKYPVDLAVENFDALAHDPTIILHSGGNLGLGNLGNTCYMNSALQCLVHLPEINYYFFFDLYERELNRTNPLGNKGDVAIAFSNLLHKLFDANNSSSSYVTPRDFKYTIGRYSSMFHGYQQQDSQEFLSWLLDALHEDLNRIHDKPYLEKPELSDEDVGNPTAISELANTCWSQHKQRNDSIIVDLFTGLYQSTLICPDCSKQSVTFDPFNDLTLPLPVDKKWYHVFTIVDLGSGAEGAAIQQLEVELTKTSNYDDLLKYLSDFLRVPASHLFLFEVFRDYFYRSFQDTGSASKFLPVSELISNDDCVIVYIIPHDPSSDLIVPLVNVVQDDCKSYNLSEPFGIPLFIVVDKNSEVESFGLIRKKVEQAVKVLTNSDIEQQFEALKDGSGKSHYAATDFPLLSSSLLNDDTIMVDANQIESEENDDGYDSDVSLANPTISAALGFEIKVYEEKLQTRSSIRSYGSESVSSSESSNPRIPRTRPQFGTLPLLAGKLTEMKRNFYHYPEYVDKVRLRQRFLKDSDGNEADSEKYDTETEDPDMSVFFDNVTVIGGIPAEFDPKKISDELKRELACGGEVTRNSMVCLHGDHTERVKEFFSSCLLLSEKDFEVKLRKASDFVKSDSALQSTNSSENEKSSYVMVDHNPATGESNTVLKEERKPTRAETLTSPLNDEDIDSDTNWDSVNPLFDSIDNFDGPPKSPNGTEGMETNQSSSSDEIHTTAVEPRPALVSEKTMLVIEWAPEVYGQFFGIQQQAWREPEVIPNPKLEENRRLLSKRQKSTISLYDCFKNFSTPEVLGEQDLWYCPRCKDHKRASKTIQLWSTGEFLTIHLKRFQSARHFSDKIDMVVDFPIEGLDMTEFVSSNAMQNESLIYDLVAVDEHYGGLGGGHYTASAKNFRDGKWYRFNDGRVSALGDPSECVSSAAYLLFYKKRTTSTFAGGVGVETLLQEGQDEFEARIDDIRNRSEEVMREIEAYNEKSRVIQDDGSADAVDLNTIERQGSDESEDLYADSDSSEQHPVSGISTSVPHKKSRSPTGDAMKFEFENQRKQRLISKDSDSSRSINILGYSSSVSNLASPTGSVNDDEAI